MDSRDDDDEDDDDGSTFKEIYFRNLFLRSGVYFSNFRGHL